MRVNINSGAALLLYTFAYFGLNFMAAYYPAIAQLYITALGGLTGAFAGFLVKRNSNNKIELESQKSGVAMQRGDPLK
jgi:positive regulator of sigma E activity